MKLIKDITEIDRVAQDVERYGEKEAKHWKKYDFFELSDGLRIILTPARAKSITTTIWESDEDEQGHYVTPDYYAPDENARKKLFFAENMRNLDDITEHARHSNRTLYVSKPAWINSTLRNIIARHDHEIDNWHDTERPMTAEEIASLEKWEEEQRRAMAERLERYWKRYNNKIRVDTYWVNR